MGSFKFIETVLLCLGPFLVRGQSTNQVPGGQSPPPVLAQTEQAVPAAGDFIDGHFVPGHFGTLTTGEHPLDEIPDFTNPQDAVEQPDGSLCIIKVKFVEKLEKQHIKECWHQNVKSCHETFVTDFKAMQERKCDDNTFWKTCKISFKEITLNYTVRTCFRPLIQNCDKLYDGQTEVVCRTWFETQCNTTYVQTHGQEYHTKDIKDIEASTWCERVPKKLCAPDHCKYVEGPEECREKTIPSTMVQPEESCDLQPATDCQIVTNLVPHLNRREICEEVPKEFCHMKLDNPRIVQKPVTMKWCTFPNGTQTGQPEPAQQPLEVNTLPFVPPQVVVQDTPQESNPSQLNNPLAQFDLQLVEGEPSGALPTEISTGIPTGAQTPPPE